MSDSYRVSVWYWGVRSGIVSETANSHVHTRMCCHAFDFRAHLLDAREMHGEIKHQAPQIAYSLHVELVLMRLISELTFLMVTAACSFTFCHTWCQHSRPLPPSLASPFTARTHAPTSRNHPSSTVRQVSTGHAVART
eukprot:48929-Rhodomonas_salina.2